MVQSFPVAFKDRDSSTPIRILAWLHKPSLLVIPSLALLLDQINFLLPIICGKMVGDGQKFIGALHLGLEVRGQIFMEHFLGSYLNIVGDMIEQSSKLVV